MGNLAVFLWAFVLFFSSIAFCKQVDHSKHLVHLHLKSKFNALKLDNKLPEHDLTYNFFQNSQNLGSDALLNEEKTNIIAESFFDPESAESLKKILTALIRTDYSNALVLAEPGVGKSFLINQIVAMFSFGIMPEYLKEMLNIDETSPEENHYQKILSSFLANTLVVRINNDLLTRGNPEPGQPYQDQENRMQRVITELFSEAQKEFSGVDKSGKHTGTGKRTLFVFDEFATLPGFVKELLKTLQDQTGYQSTGNAFSAKKDPGFSVLALTTPDEFQKYAEGDTAVERRFSKVMISEPSEETTFRIAKKKCTFWKNIYGPDITDEAISYLIHSRKFLTSPPQAMPGSILTALNDLYTFKITNRDDHPSVITLEDSQKFLIKRVGLTDTWLPGPNGEPALFDLEKRVSNIVVIKEGDHSVEKIAQRWKAYVRLEAATEPIPIFIIMGPTGSGKDTRFEAFNLALFGHRGKKFMFNVSRQKDFSIDSIIYGPPLGNHESHIRSSVIRLIDSGENGALAFNEAAELPSYQFDKLKESLENGIRPPGRDSRVRYLRHPVFLLGQWGEKMYEGKTDKEKMEIYRSLTQEDIEKILLEGNENGEIGALPPALLERAKRSGGIYAVPPILSSDFPKVINSWLPSIIKGLKNSNHVQASVSPELLEFIALTAKDMAHGVRGLGAVTSDFIITAISKAMDQKLVRNGEIKLTYSKNPDRIVVTQPNTSKEWSFSPEELYRHKFSCSKKVEELGKGEEKYIDFGAGLD